jgi:hypothetical protein
MNKIIKLLIVAAAALTGLSACNQDNERAFYDESAPAAYSFLQPVVSAELTPEYNNAIKVRVTRTNAVEAASVQLKLTASTATAAATLFTLDSPTVSFEAGVYEAVATVRFTLTDLAPDGTRYKFAIEFVDPATVISTGGSKITNVDVSRQLTFVSVGSGTYVSTLFGQTFEAPFERAVEAPNLYKLVGFFTNPILINVDFNAGTAVIPLQDLGEDVFNAGSNSWIKCANGAYANGVITFGGGTAANAFFTSQAMTSGAPMTNEKFLLPAGSY